MVCRQAKISHSWYPSEWLYLYGLGPSRTLLIKASKRLFMLTDNHHGWRDLISLILSLKISNRISPANTQGANWGNWIRPRILVGLTTLTQWTEWNAVRSITLTEINNSVNHSHLSLERSRLVRPRCGRLSTHHDEVLLWGLLTLSGGGFALSFSGPTVSFSLSSEVAAIRCRHKSYNHHPPSLSHSTPWLSDYPGEVAKLLTLQ